MQAYQIQQENIWGGITLLSKEYEVSRTFIYSLLFTFRESLESQFSPKEKLSSPSRETIEARILAYRFEGKSSIDGISTLMKRDGLPFSATGSISQILTRLGKSRNFS